VIDEKKEGEIGVESLVLCYKAKFGLSVTEKDVARIFRALNLSKSKQI